MLLINRKLCFLEDVWEMGIHRQNGANGLRFQCVCSGMVVVTGKQEIKKFAMMSLISPMAKFDCL